MSFTKNRHILLEKAKLLKVLLYIAIVCFIFSKINKHFYTPTREVETKLNQQNISNTKKVSGKNITRIIHQSWKRKNLPHRFNKWSKYWKETCYPDWQYLLWDDADSRRLIVDHYSWFLKQYDKFSREIYRADVVRYFYMYHYGGIYADLDTYCIRPFDHLLENYTLVFGAMRGVYGIEYVAESYTQNSFFYSRPKQAFWMMLIRSILDGDTQNPLNQVEYVTGPMALSKHINLYRSRNEQDFRKLDHLKVYEPIYFNPFSWIEYHPAGDCMTLNEMDEGNIVRCIKKHTQMGSYVLQFHTQSYGDGKPL